MRFTAEINKEELNYKIYDNGFPMFTQYAYPLGEEELTAENIEALASEHMNYLNENNPEPEAEEEIDRIIELGNILIDIQLDLFNIMTKLEESTEIEIEESEDV